MCKLEKNFSVRKNTDKFENKNQTSGAKTVPKRNSCEYLLFTGVIFLPAFNLFDLLSTFRNTMIYSRKISLGNEKKRDGESAA